MLRWRTAVCVLTATTMVAACSSSSNSSSPSGSPASTVASTASTPSTDAVATTTATDPTSTVVTKSGVDPVAALQAGGVPVLAVGATIPSDSGPIAASDFQAAAWARQDVDGGGVTGATLRAEYPTGTGQVPLDALVAAWLVKGQSVAATQARTLVDATTITDPATVTYPWAVLALFVNDIIHSGGTIEGFGPSRSVHQPTLAARPSRDGANACDTLGSLYNQTIGQITAWFTVDASDGLIVSVAKAAASLFADVLGDIVSAALAPILAPLKTAIAALGTATAIANAVVPWTPSLHSVPADNSFGIPPDTHTGTLVFDEQDPAGFDWPGVVKSCAALIPVELPPVNPVGTPVTWSDPDPSIATEVSKDAMLTGTADAPTASLIYRVADQDPDLANGPVLTTTLTMTASVDRDRTKAIEPLLQSVISHALSVLPDAVASLLAGVGSDLINGVIDASDPPGQVSVDVTYQDGAAPTTTTEPATTTTMPASNCVDETFLSDVTTYAPTNETLPAGLTVVLHADGTGLLDATGSGLYTFNGGTGTLSGQIHFSWTADASGQNIVGNKPYGGISLTIDVSGISETVALPLSIFQGTEGISCIGDVLTFTRTGQTYHDAGPAAPATPDSVPAP
ncbi:MAG: hypothetical protein JWM34_1948 [Ilumatobacteraceae bacterium]|nr:hypothetical protein [Ilumatobacteraceae bacterium]